MQSFIKKCIFSVAVVSNVSLVNEIGGVSLRGWGFCASRPRRASKPKRASKPNTGEVDLRGSRQNSDETMTAEEVVRQLQMTLKAAVIDTVSKNSTKRLKALYRTFDADDKEAKKEITRGNSETDFANEISDLLQPFKYTSALMTILTKQVNRCYVENIYFKLKHFIAELQSVADFTTDGEELKNILSFSGTAHFFEKPNAYTFLVKEFEKRVIAAAEAFSDIYVDGVKEIPEHAMQSQKAFLSFLSSELSQIESKK